MNNFSVSRKLVGTYVLMFVLSAVLFFFGYSGMNRLDASGGSLMANGIQPYQRLADIRASFSEQLALIQKLSFVSGNMSAAKDITNEISAGRLSVETNMAAFEEIIAGDGFGDETEQLKDSFGRFKTSYTEFFTAEITYLKSNPLNLNTERLAKFLTSDELATMGHDLDECNQLIIAHLDGIRSDMGSVYRTAVLVLIITFGVCFVFNLTGGILLPVSIARPLRRLVKVANAAAEGDMEMVVPDQNREDEVGKLAQAFERMKSEIQKQISVVEAFSHADLTVEPQPRGEKDKLGKALLMLYENLNRIISDVASASENVAREARQVSAQSQDLAQGSTEQAASVEQLSSAFFEISLNTKESAGSAAKAADLSNSVRTMADEGDKQMNLMIQAIKQADTASKNIETIIKTIEEISFLTNILALNAAVEAAHAGQNGSGFAVVAAEVRQLASKSSASSKETSELIANTIEKVQLSQEIAALTSESFHQIVSGVNNTTKLIGDIAKSTEEQASAIDQINTGISQVAQVIQANSGSAEKCASAADLLSTQSNLLSNSIAMFKTKHNPAGRDSSASAAPAEKTIKIDLKPSIPSGDFGKY